MEVNHIYNTNTTKNVLLRRVACLVTMDFEEFHPTQKDTTLRPLKNVDVLIKNGIIEEISQEPLKNTENILEIEGQNWTIFPGLIDSHHHPLFAGSRAKETVQKAQGMSYEEIAAQGGGIASTMLQTRQASEDELLQNLTRHLKKSLSLGVTLQDVKTGYGLQIEEELKHIRVVSALLKKTQGGELSLPSLGLTLLGPHAKSPNYEGLDSFIEALIEALPQFQEATSSLTPFLTTLATDIFLERNYFTKEQAQKWLLASLQYGFDVRLHADEFSRSGGAELAYELAQNREQSTLCRTRPQILSIDHGQYATASDLTHLASCGVVATALPLTSLFSNIPFVDAGTWRSSGVKVAIASDFNPGSAPCNNLWLAAYLALTRCGFTLPEVLAGVTTHAAWAMKAENTHGRIQVGMPANLVAVWGKEPEDFFASATGDHVAWVMVSPLNSRKCA